MKECTLKAEEVRRDLGLLGGRIAGALVTVGGRACSGSRKSQLPGESRAKLISAQLSKSCLLDQAKGVLSTSRRLSRKVFSSKMARWKTSHLKGR